MSDYYGKSKFWQIVGGIGVIFFLLFLLILLTSCSASNRGGSVVCIGLFALCAVCAFIVVSATRLSSMRLNREKEYEENE